jgi:hypothetical protein
MNTAEKIDSYQNVHAEMIDRAKKGAANNGARHKTYIYMADGSIETIAGLAEKLGVSHEAARNRVKKRQLKNIPLTLENLKDIKK